MSFSSQKRKDDNEKIPAFVCANCSSPERKVPFRTLDKDMCSPKCAQQYRAKKCPPKRKETSKTSPSSYGGSFAY